MNLVQFDENGAIRAQVVRFALQVRNQVTAFIRREGALNLRINVR